MITEDKIIHKLLEQNKSYTIRELAQAIGSDYKITHTAMQRLLKEGLISSKTIGKSTYCTLNSLADKLKIHEVEAHRRINILQKNKDLQQVFKEVMSKIDTFSFVWLLFGSHAKGTANKHSDFDFMFISNEEDFEEKVNHILRLLPLKIHSPQVFKEKEFIRMKDSKEPNVVTEAVAHNIILYGIEQYYYLKNA